MNRWLVLTPIALLGMALLVGCSEEEAPPAPVRPVLSVIASQKAVEAMGFAGTVEPRYSRDLGFRVLGRLVARDVEIGQSVKAGDTLALLDPSELQLAVRALEAELAKSEAQLLNATATKERRQALVEKNVASQAEYDTAEEARSAAAAQVARARAQLDKAREQLTYTRLISETDGIVTALEAEVGQTVTAGQTVVTVAETQVREAVVDVPDDIARTIRQGDYFEATLQVDPRARAQGRVREVAPQADAATRSRRVRITLQDAPPSFRVGTTVNAVPVETDRSSIVLPRTARLERDGKSFVWVVDEQALTVSLRPVEIAGEVGPVIRVSQGIEAGTRVVTAGVNSLTDGQKIKIAEESVK
jgi:RND family efflux transporter MFP subunit